MILKGFAMTTEEFNRIFVASTMTQQELANYLRVHIRSVQRYLAGELRIIGPVEKLMELLNEKIAREYPKPKGRSR